MNKAEKKVVNQAIRILEKHMVDRPVKIQGPESAITFLRLNLESLEHEVFGVMFLDSKHRLIEFSILFRGTIDSASVPVREVIKETLSRNAAAVILSHNHPSGVAEPSAADKALTETITLAMNLIGVKVLDHIIIGSGEITSFAENGWL